MTTNLIFEDISYIYTYKVTKTFRVYSSHDKEHLGVINWYPKWRQYIFDPNIYTIYSDNCLKELAEFITKLNKEHKDGLR